MTSLDFNNECIKKLHKSGFQDRVAVIGSGPSCPFITSLDELMKRLRKTCGIRKHQSDYHWVFFEKAYKKNPRKYFEAIKVSFSNTPEWDARAYEYLANINFRSFVTLNYDDQLPTAFRRLYEDDFDSRFRVYPTRGTEKFWEPGDLFAQKQRLVAIHGYKNDNDTEWHKHLILRVSDYNTHYGDGKLSDGRQTHPYLYSWWHTLLTTQPCVFIGTSLHEPGLRLVVEDLIKDGNPYLKRQDHIHLKHTERADKLPFYESPGTSLLAIRQVLFDKVDPKFSGLTHVLSAFSNKATGRPVPTMPKRTPITMDSNFEF
jgi:hypothetical protein